MIDLHCKKLYEDAKLPTRAYEHDAGWDLYVHNLNSLPGAPLKYKNMYRAGEIATVYTGIALAIPNGYVGLIMDRSSMGSKGISRLAGVIDSGYRGEVIVKLTKVAGEKMDYLWLSHGDKVAQLLIVPIPATKLVEVSDLPPSERGEKGFGSSGT